MIKLSILILDSERRDGDELFVFLMMFVHFFFVCMCLKIVSISTIINLSVGQEAWKYNSRLFLNSYKSLLKI